MFIYRNLKLVNIVLLYRYLISTYSIIYLSIYIYIYTLYNPFENIYMIIFHNKIKTRRCMHEKLI